VPRIAIIGLGMIGGSIGLALRRAAVPDLEVAGYDSEWGVGGKARKAGAIDRDCRSAGAAAGEGAKLVVIATPIMSIPQVLRELGGSLAEGAVVTDTASTKRQVLRWAEELLPDTVSFVGGHPMAGSERTGIEAADAALFDGCGWAVTPSMKADESALQTVLSLIGLAGATPVFIDSEEHDSYVAAVSHLPLVLSAALFSLASGSPAWSDLAALAGTAFRDLTRLASSSPDLAHGICRTNRENLLHWIDRFADELGRYRRMIADTEDDKALLETFARVQLDRDTFLRTPPRRPQPAAATDEVNMGEQLRALLIGDYAARRLKDLQGALERRPADHDALRRKLEDG